MAEKETIFSSSMKYEGIFSFKDFYKFCYDWLTEQTDLLVAEKEYSEKLKGDSKDIDIKWTGSRKLTDYFKFESKVEFRILNLTEVEVARGDTKFKTNKGQVKVKIKGILIRDWQGKFERTAFGKFLRSIYDKWVIPGRIEQFEDKIIGDSDEFLSQAKAWLDLEGKR